MELFTLEQHSRIILMSTNLESIKDKLRELYLNSFTQFSTMTGWNRQYYVDADNYAARQMVGLMINRINLESGDITFPTYDSRTHTWTTPEGIENITNEVFTVDDARYQGALKLFATVTKTGIKSSGMEVIVDPQVSGSDIRPIEEYQALVGTFARVKASTQIHEYGCVTFFFAPESLGNYRIETQLVNGKRFTIH